MKKTDVRDAGENTNTGVTRSPDPQPFLYTQLWEEMIILRRERMVRSSSPLRCSPSTTDMVLVLNHDHAKLLVGPAAMHTCGLCCLSGLRGANCWIMAAIWF
jgi:hypothetical protein